MEKFFHLKEKGTTVRTEIIAGITTFLAMAYIIFVNPTQLSDPAKIMGDMVMSEKIFHAVFFATCISAFIGTMLMALLAKMPFAQASGMGLNSFFAYTVMLTLGYTYYQALAMVFISGILFIAITVFGLREAIIRAIPKNIKTAISGGIGLFIAFIGLKNAGIVVSNENTFVSLCDFSVLVKSKEALLPAFLDGSIADPAAAQAAAEAAIANAKVAAWGAILALLGVLLITVLYFLKIKGSILIGILGITAIGIPFGVTVITGAANAFTDFSSTFATQWNDFVEIGLFSFVKGFGELFAGKNILDAVLSVIVIVVSFSLVDMFDTIGTLLGTAKKANLLDETGNMPGMKKALLCDAIATTTGAMLGTSTVTTYVESSAGIGEGGRTGLTSLVTACLFLLAIPLSPFIGIVPSAATAPALIFVGALMLMGIKDMVFDDLSELFPAFLTIIMMPLTYSIANGIAFGLISYTIIKICSGKIKEVNIITAVLALLFTFRFFIMAM